MSFNLHKRLERLPTGYICSKGRVMVLLDASLLPTMRQTLLPGACQWQKVSAPQLISLTESRASLCLFHSCLSSLFSSLRPLTQSYQGHWTRPLFPYRPVMADHGPLSKCTEGNGEVKALQTANPQTSTKRLIWQERLTFRPPPHSSGMTRSFPLPPPPSYSFYPCPLWTVNNLFLRVL